MQVSNTQDIHQLNSFLRGERAAVETYEKAIETVKDTHFSKTLQDCKSSHIDRVMKLSEKISQLGGSPAQSSGVWGAFAALVENSAALINEEKAVSVLEEGEEHGLKDYQGDLSNLSSSTRAWVDSYLIPEQQRTYAVLRNMREILGYSSKKKGRTTDRTYRSDAQDFVDSRRPSSHV